MRRFKNSVQFCTFLLVKFSLGSNSNYCDEDSPADNVCAVLESTGQAAIETCKSYAGYYGLPSYFESTCENGFRDGMVITGNYTVSNSKFNSGGCSCEYTKDSHWVNGKPDSDYLTWCAVDSRKKRSARNRISTKFRMHEKNSRRKRQAPNPVPPTPKYTISDLKCTFSTCQNDDDVQQCAGILNAAQAGYETCQTAFSEYYSSYTHLLPACKQAIQLGAAIGAFMLSNQNKCCCQDDNKAKAEQVTNPVSDPNAITWCDGSQSIDDVVDNIIILKGLDHSSVLLKAVLINQFHAEDLDNQNCGVQHDGTTDNGCLKAVQILVAHKVFFNFRPLFQWYFLENTEQSTAKKVILLSKLFKKNILRAFLIIHRGSEIGA